MMRYSVLHLVAFSIVLGCSGEKKKEDKCEAHCEDNSRVECFENYPELENHIPCETGSVCVHPAGDAPFCAQAAESDLACEGVVGGEIPDIFHLEDPELYGLTCDGHTLTLCRTGFIIEQIDCDSLNADCVGSPVDGHPVCMLRTVWLELIYDGGGILSAGVQIEVDGYPPSETHGGTNSSHSKTYEMGLTAFISVISGEEHFEGWGGDCSGTELSCEVLLDQDRSVTATFQ
jgi:hypothetical protein